MNRELTATRNHGIDAARAVVEETSKANAEVYIISDNKRVNAKSIMGLLSLSLKKGDTLTVEANGEDADKIIELIEKII